MPYQDSRWPRHLRPFGSLRTVEYERAVIPLLGGLFGERHVEVQWRPMLEEESRGWNRNGARRQLTYAPAVDIAVGPFATHGELTDRYDLMEREHTSLLDGLLSAHVENTVEFGSRFRAPSREDLRNANHNPRCFLAIELENGIADPKHHLGSVVNAVALSRIPVLIGLRPGRLASLLRLREYILQLDEYRKNVFSAHTMIVLSGEQLFEVLQTH